MPTLTRSSARLHALPAGESASPDTRLGPDVSALIALGVDQPLKLDIVAAIEQRLADRGDVDTLAAAVASSAREVILALEALQRAGIVRVARVFNFAEYEYVPPADLRERLRALVGATAEESRRMRRAILIRTAGA